MKFIFETPFPGLDTIIILISSHKLSAHTWEQHFVQSRKGEGLVGPSILSLKHYLLKDSGRRGITTLSCICICGAHELRQIALNSAMQMVLVYLLMTQTPVPIILPATLPMFLQYLAESSVIINKYPINLYYATVILSFKYFLNLTSYSISIYIYFANYGLFKHYIWGRWEEPLLQKHSICHIG